MHESVFCLSGPTATGKTALALAWAAQSAQSVEIISADSALIYRDMDIGTAKPSLSERAHIPHHLIDICEPETSYSVAQFVRDTHGLIADIRARGKCPLIVGGTMLYIKTLASGLQSMPETDANIRTAILQEAAIDGWPAMHEQLLRIDPHTAHRLAPSDAQRIGRALEVYRSSGRTLSDYHQDAPLILPPLHLRIASLESPTTTWLHQRIALRTQTMLAQGFEDEVRRLRARGTLNAQMPSLRCVGYRQIWEKLESQAEMPAALVSEKITIATRQLAKRQMTWLRSLPNRSVIDASACDTLAALRRVWAV